MSQQVLTPDEEIDLEDESGSAAGTVVTRALAAELGGLRLDQAAAQAFPEYSRARLQQWLKEGRMLVNGRLPKAKDRVIGGEQVELRIEPAPSEDIAPEPLPLDIVYEDAALIIVNKPVGLVVHPAAGNRTGTLLNGLLAHAPQLAQLPRCGIVHRIDKDTSGLLVVAKTLQAHQDLVAQLQEHSVTRQYEAVVCGVVIAGGTVDAPLGRHLSQRQKRAVVEPEAPDARPAVTHYRVKARYRSHTHLSLQLETGRTHQIRVHMAHIGFPIVGDQVYGGRLKLPKGAVPDLLDFLQQFKRQALHARVLGFEHPETGEYMEWESPLPEDFQQLLALLEKDRA
jgi:23S rRNA pseudouridine1911/1915/1917 synthase